MPEHPYQGNWVLNKNKKGSFFSTPVRIDQVFEKEGKFFGWQEGTTTPIELDYSELLTEKNVENLRYENLPKELQQKYQGVFDRIEQTKKEGQVQSRKLYEEFFQNNPNHSYEDFAKFRLNHINYDLGQEEIDQIKERVNQTKAPPEPPKPPVNETKVENTTEKVRETTENKNHQTPKPPPEPPSSVPRDTPKIPPTPHVNQTDIPNMKKTAGFLEKNHGKIIMGAIGVGLIGAALDSDNDDISSAAAKGVKAGILATGASYAGQVMFKKETVQDLVKGELSQAAKEAKLLQTEQKMLKIGSKIPKVMGIGLIAIGAASLLDAGRRVGDHMEAKSYEREQEWEMKQRVKKQKQKNKEQSYGYLQDGEIVLDLFSTRSGHHKMGNARFQ